MRWYILLATIIVGLFGTYPAQAQTPTIPAFPGAEGFGAVATGGRGGKVIYVTTLANDGPGSLAEALNTPGTRYILFKVSGVINTTAEFRYGDVTIAGQTSPGGIIVRGLICDGHYETNKCDNLIVRHMRSRPAAHITRDGAGVVLDDALRLDGVENVIVDHGSFANANDEAGQISLARNITIQNSILAETVGEHHIFGGMLLNYSHSKRPQDNISVHHNMWHRITGRLPEISCEMTRGLGSDEAAEKPSFCSKQPLNLELASNLFWDAGGPGTYNSNADDGQGQPEAGLFTLRMNWVNNYMVVRPDYPFGMIADSYTNQPKNELFVSGNKLNLYPKFADGQLAYCCNDFKANAPNNAAPRAKLRTERFPFPTITYIPTEKLIDYVVKNVGAYPRDLMDRRYIQALQTGKIDPAPREAPAANDAFTLDFDPQAAPQAPTDSDSDGMPDAWEQENGLNPQAQDHNGTELSKKLTGIEGYTNLEVYLNLLSDQLVASKK
jgi:pectate lyase